jgi:hypothetical protein
MPTSRELSGESSTRGRKTMTVYVAEINGRAIAALDAETKSAAEEWFGGEVFCSDLSSLEDEENQPLWDGKSEIHVRQAVNEEAEEWKKSHAKALLEKEIDEDDEWLVFLIPVIDVADEEDDEDED